MSFKFFETLFPGTSPDGRDLGYATLVLPVKPQPGNPSPSDKVFSYAWPSQKESLIAFCIGHREQDIYVVPALFREQETLDPRKIAHQWVARVDADTMDLKRLKAEPTMVVESSPGRHHLYWSTRTDDPQRLTALSHAIGTAHADHGCEKDSWEPERLLRVPGSFNSKTASHEVRIKAVTDTTWDVEALEGVYTADDSQQTAVIPMPDREDWDFAKDSLEEANQVFALNPEIYDLAFSEMVAGQDGLATMKQLLVEMARKGVSRNTALHIAWNAKTRSEVPSLASAEAVWNELCFIYADRANAPVVNSPAASTIEAAERMRLDEAKENPEKRVKDFISNLGILHEHERPLVPDDTFIDRYVEWARTRTDAPDVYHRAVAVTILSCVFGEFGSCPTRFDSNLTLWVLLLGPTTRARKTTAMMLGVDMLTELQTPEYSYLLGSDVTSEALSVTLPKRHGRTSFFYRDEAHGLLYEQDKKRYLAGLREHMTELYGGRVRQRLRAGFEGGGNDDEEEEENKAVGNIRTNFVMFLCGTMDQMTGALTIQDYQSGHLARFLVAEADPPPLTEADVWIPQYDGVDRTDDSARQALMNGIDNARRFWEGLCGLSREKLRMVHFEPDAWNRLHKARWELINAAQSHEMDEVLLPTSDRMGHSLMKAAVLIAMSDSSTVVRMEHLLKAMQLCEEWYSATVGIAGKILHSSWSASQEEILTKIRSSTDGVTQQEIYRTFRTKMQEKDIESVLNVLIKAGLVRRVNEQRGRVRYIRISRI